MELLYPEWQTMQHLLGVWSTRRNPIWAKLYASTQFDYNPIENYDRKENWIDNSNTDDTSGASQTTHSSTQGSEHSTTVNTVQGYDGGDWENHDKSDVDANTSSHSDGSMEGNTKRLTVGENKREGRAHGNIGVTTTQTMIKEERDIVNFDVYGTIVSDFIDTFCVAVY